MTHSPIKRCGHSGFCKFEKSEIEQSIPTRFSQQVLRHGKRLAVRSPITGDLTYRELDERSNRVANMLLEICGLDCEPVAFLLDQGAPAIEIILGILKAGKIYVALNPQLSVGELQRIATDCSPGLVCTDTKYFAIATKISQGSIRCINIDEMVSKLSRTNPEIKISPDDLAYIYYTSGSTGPPKGVCDSHRNILHNIMRYTNKLQIGVEDRLSLIQSFAFSGTVSGLFAALLNGASIYPFDLRSHGIERLAEWIDEEKLTLFHSVPVIFERLMAQQRQFAHLRFIRLEGDRADTSHVEAFRAHFGPKCALVNGLGTTETGIIRQYFITGGTILPGGTVPVGHAVEDMEVLLLDSDGNSVPDGSAGEIALRSRYLAVGYWNNPDLTAARFTNDPHLAGYRIYSTGDMGRMLSGNCLQYLERKNFGGKIRGQRVEIAEIEDALCSMSTISRALVTAREDRQGYQQLVAYIVPQDAAPNVSEIRRFLSKILPSIMIPVKYVQMDALPKDTNSKILRRGLPAPDNIRPTLASKFVAPSTYRQQLLAKCFERILNISPVGLHDSFYDLGGDSLQAAELSICMEQELKLSCPPEFMMTASTVADLDELLTQSHNRIRAVPINSLGFSRPLFVIINRAHLYKNLAQILDSKISVIGVHWAPWFEPEGQNTLPRLAQACLAEIKRHCATGPYRICGNCFDGVVAFEVAQQLLAAGDKVEFLGLIDTAFPNAANSTSRRPNGIRGIAAQSQKWLRKNRVFIHKRLLRYFPKSMFTRFLVRQFRRDIALYRPQSYDGEAILLCPGEPHNHKGWQSVIERLEIVKISGAAELSSGPVPHLVEYPFVLDLTQELIDHLLTRAPAKLPSPKGVNFHSDSNH